MPIRKFRSVEEMNQPRWREPGDPELLDAIRYLWELAQMGAAPRFPPGVYKHSSIEEAQLLRQEWQDANVARKMK